MAFHPLGPLSSAEFVVASAILTREHGSGDGWRFTSLEMTEPAETQITAFEATGVVPDRHVRLIVLERTANATYTAIVSLTIDTVESWIHDPGVQPNFTVDEWMEADLMLRAHPPLIAALAKRGITDPGLVFTDTWTQGDALIPQRSRGRRLGWSDTWLRAAVGTNPCAGLVNGLHCVLDVNTREVLEIEDSFSVDTPEIMDEYTPHLIPERIPNASRRPRSGPSTSCRPTARASVWTATSSSGRTGRCDSVPTTARG